MNPDRSGAEAPLETVTSHDDVVGLGMPVDADEVSATLTVEREFLTALIWAPAELTTKVVRALAGQDGSAPTSALLYSQHHRTVFARVVESVVAGAPLEPSQLGALAADPNASLPLRNLLMEIASPNPADPWPLATDADLPALALSVVDQWHRRGYRALLARMSTVLETERNDDLAAHWEALSVHQRSAEATRSAIRSALS